MLTRFNWRTLNYRTCVALSVGAQLDEIQFIREGRGVWRVSGQTFEASAGDIFVIKAGEIHSFRAVGKSPLVQLDVHLSPRFIQENL